MDLSKALDCLPHQLIIAKLHACGTDLNACALLWSYLSHCMQCVGINSRVSNWMPVTKGVPQGSISSLYSFNLFVNDLNSTFANSSLYNYTDDNTLSVSTKTRDQVVDNLTSETRLAVDWFKVNMMEVKPLKSRPCSTGTQVGTPGRLLGLTGLTLPVNQK